MAVALVWFRDDLRLDDQPALRAALERGWLPVPVYIHAPEEEGDWAPGAASDAWRRRSLAALADALAAHNEAESVQFATRIIDTFTYYLIEKKLKYNSN